MTPWWHTLISRYLWWLAISYAAALIPRTKLLTNDSAVCGWWCLHAKAGLTITAEHQWSRWALDPGLRDGVGHHTGVVSNIWGLHFGDVQVPRLLRDEASSVLLHICWEFIEDPGEQQICDEGGEQISDETNTVMRSLFSCFFLEWSQNSGRDEDILVCMGCDKFQTSSWKWKCWQRHITLRWKLTTGNVRVLHTLVTTWEIPGRALSWLITFPHTTKQSQHILSNNSHNNK